MALYQPPSYTMICALIFEVVYLAKTSVGNKLKVIPSTNCRICFDLLKTPYLPERKSGTGELYPEPE